MSFLRGLIAAGVRNPVYANMLLICLLAGGVYAARTLVTETYPEFSYDRISIEVAYPGASPEEVELSVCSKIEEALEGLAGVKKAWSQATEGGALVVVEVLDSVDDIRGMMLDVKDRVDRITTFPPEVERPVVSEMLARAQVINLAVYGDAPERTLKEIASEIKYELLANDTISQVRMTGARDYEISIEVSREALLQYGLTLQQVTTAVTKNSVDVPAGTLRTKGEELTLRTTGRRYTAQEFENLVLIARPDGTMITLGQVAKVTDGFEEDYKAGLFEGTPAIVLEVFKTEDQDTSTIARTVRDYVAQKRLELPKQIRLDTWADSSREVDARITMLAENGLLGMILVVLTLTVFLDFRVSLYVAAGIPASFAGALMVMHWTGETLNMITLFGLITVTGIIVDDAIVIADGFRQRALAGEAPALAAINGPVDVALPVAASSLTTILAFAPLLFVVGIMGKFIAVLPVVVIAAIVFSGIEAFCILPSHLQHCMSGGGSGRIAAWRRRVRTSIDTWFDGVVARYYRPLCAAGLRSRGLTLSLAFAAALLTLGLVAGGRVPFTLLPEIDGDLVRARVRFPYGVPVSTTEAAIRQLEKAALELNDRSRLAHSGDGDLVQKRFSVVGEWSDWIGESGSNLCEVMLELMPAEQRHLDGDRILDMWRRQTGDVADAVVVTFDRLSRGPADKPLEVRLLDDDLERLQRAADEASAKLAEYAGVSDIENDLLPGKREVRVRLKPMARTLGVTLDDLAMQLRTGFFGGEAVRVQRGRDEVRVQVRFPEAQRQNISDIERLRIQGPGGREIPFRELVDYEIRRGYAAIRHQDGTRRVRIMADVDQRRANAEHILAQFEHDYLRKLPQQYPGMKYRIEGQHLQMVESLESLIAGFIVAIIGIYAVLGAILKSYYQPIVIMVAIPLGLVGAVVGHLVLGYDLTIMSVFGMAAMAGVVVNDSLVLLDQINASIAQGVPVVQATLKAGQVRFRSVILTTVTTIAGLAPLLAERSSQAQTLIPMAISLTFGLAFATVLTLVIVPALYLVANDARRTARWLRRGGPYPSAETVEPLHGSATLS